MSLAKSSNFMWPQCVWDAACKHWDVQDPSARLKALIEQAILQLMLDFEGYPFTIEKFDPIPKPQQPQPQPKSLNSATTSNIDAIIDSLIDDTERPPLQTKPQSQPQPQSIPKFYSNDTAFIDDWPTSGKVLIRDALKFWDPKYTRDGDLHTTVIQLIDVLQQNEFKEWPDIAEGHQRWILMGARMHRKWVLDTWGGNS